MVMSVSYRPKVTRQTVPFCRSRDRDPQVQRGSMYSCSRRYGRGIQNGQCWR